MAREGWTIGDLFGRAADFVIPGDAYNPRAPSFGEGWTSSGWGRGFAGAQHGNFGPLGGELGSIYGGRLIPFVGGQLGRKGGTWLGNLASRIFGNNPSMPEFSNYGPYAGGYQGLPSYTAPGDFTMPEFFGDGPGYISPEAPKPDNYVETDKPRGGTERWSGPPMGVTNMMVNGSPVIRGVTMPMGHYAVYNGRKHGNSS